jgi:hypothetical protein
MTIRYSTGLRDKIQGLKGEVKGAVIGAGLTFVDGGGSADTITDGGTGFITQDFAPGDILFCLGATTGANDTDITGVVIAGVVAGTLTIPTGSVDTGESGAAGTVIACAKGGSLKDVLKDGVMYVYSGSQPGDPDDAVSSTLLMTITQDSLTFTAAAFDNGLEFEDDPLDGVIEKASGEVWSGVCTTAGQAGWFMICGNATDARGSSSTLPRMTGSIGTANADAIMPSTTLTVGKTYTLDSFALTLPMFYGA